MVCFVFRDFIFHPRLTFSYDHCVQDTQHAYSLLVSTDGSIALVKGRALHKDYYMSTCLDSLWGLGFLCEGAHVPAVGVDTFPLLTRLTRLTKLTRLTRLTKLTRLTRLIMA